mmetsp:Transcript_12168/g.33758  ORF Transcript_12168/g.33758 Transcript_12168/m.33758 type:complete len:214 (-) Transcript_12168:254-895(-)
MSHQSPSRAQLFQLVKIEFHILTRFLILCALFRALAALIVVARGSVGRLKNAHVVMLNVRRHVIVALVSIDHVIVGPPQFVHQRFIHEIDAFDHDPRLAVLFIDRKARVPFISIFGGLRCIIIVAIANDTGGALVSLDTVSAWTVLDARNNVLPTFNVGLLQSGHVLQEGGARNGLREQGLLLVFIRAVAVADFCHDGELLVVVLLQEDVLLL